MTVPEILIGVPTLNGPDRLARCLESIRRHTPLEAYKAQVLVSDDFSYRENLEENRKVCQNFGAELACPAQVRIGVAQQWNCLTRHAKAPIVILMNDDVEVVPDWLEALVFSIRENPQAGMVGLKAYQGVTSRNFTPPPVQSYNEAVMERGVGMISATGFLFGFERRKWDEVGGFDPHFFAFYEETDFGVSCAYRGMPAFTLPAPHDNYHIWSATFGSAPEIPAGQIMIDSRNRFVEKWSAILGVRFQDAPEIHPLLMDKIAPFPVRWLAPGKVKREAIL